MKSNFKNIFKMIGIAGLMLMHTSTIFAQNCVDYFTWTADGCEVSFTLLNPSTTDVYEWNLTANNGTTVPTVFGIDPTIALPPVPDGLWTVVLTITPSSGDTITCSLVIAVPCKQENCGESGFGFVIEDCEVNFTAPDWVSAFNYEWDFGDGCVISGIGPIAGPICNTTNDFNSPRHTYAANGTYTVTLIFTTQWPIPGGPLSQFICEREVVIENCVQECTDCSFTAEVDPLAACAQLIVNLTPECHNDGDVHTWTYNGLNIGQTTTGDTYAYSVLNINTMTNPTGIFTHSVNSDPVCSDTVTVTWDFDGIFIGAQCGTAVLANLINTGVLPSGSISNTNIFLNSSLIVDVPYEFNNCDLSMGMGTGIDVIGTTFNLNFLTLANGTTLDTDCPCLWRGINVESGAGLITKGPTVVAIRNALHATRAINTGVGNAPILSLDKTNFTANFIGTLAVDGQFSHTFKNLRYIGRPLKTSCAACPVVNDLENLYPLGNRSYAGILVRGNQDGTGAFLNINANSTGIRFNNFAVGILVDNADATINGCTFFNMKNFGYANNSGFGIRFIDGAGSRILNQNGAGTTFQFCITGIYAGAHNFGTEVYVRNNAMTNMENGITLISQDDPSIFTVGNITIGEVLDNSIQCNRNFTMGPIAHGIKFVDRELTASEFRIENNDITINQTNRLVGIWGIGLFSGTNTTSNSFIVANDVSIENGLDGIRLENISNNVVRDNMVSLTQTAWGAGLRLTLSGESLIVCNTINDIGIGQSIGIQTESSMSNTFSNNSITNTGIGFDVRGANNSGVVTKNQFIGNMDFSLAYDNQSVFGQQINRGNRWHGVQNTFVNGDGTANQYLTFADPSIPATGIHLTPIGNMSGTNLINPNGIFVDGNVNCFSIGEGFSGDPELTTLDTKIANEELTSISSGTKWHAELQLYEKIKNNPALLSDVGMSNYSTQQQNAEVGQLFELSENVEQVFEVDAQVEAEVSANKLLRQNVLQEMAIASEQLTTTTGAEAVAEALANLHSQLTELQMTNNQYISGINQEKISLAQSALAASESMEVASAPALQLKYLQELYLTKVGSSSWQFSESEMNTILNIANTCPAELGRAVFYARALYTHITGEVLDIQACDGVEERLQPATVETATELSIYPNPSDGAVQYSLANVTANSTLEIKVTDILGRIILTRTVSIDEYQGNLMLDQLTSGVYVISLYDGKQIIASDKLIIEK